MISNLNKLFVLFLLMIITQGCGIYSFTGASIPPGVTTFQVNFDCIDILYFTQVFAYEHGYINLGEVRGFPGHFMFRKENHEGSFEARHLTFALLEDGRVLWAEQQFGKLRVKRDSNIEDQPLERVKRDSPKHRDQQFLELFQRLALGFNN